MTKTLYRGADLLWLQPTNRKMRPLEEFAREQGILRDPGRFLLVGNPSGPLNNCPFASACAASTVPLDQFGNVMPAIQRRDTDIRQSAARWMVVNGPKQQYRCYAASEEAAFKGLRDILWHNDDLLRACCRDHHDHLWARRMMELIEASLVANRAWDNGSIVRVHPNGEFFNRQYLQAWLMVANRSPRNHYYAYTKAISWYVQEREAGHVPENFAFTMSYGGTQDELIDAYGLKRSVVVGSEEEAAELGLEVDHDDRHALWGKESFALVIHGVGTKHLLGTRLQPGVEREAAD